MITVDSTDNILSTEAVSPLPKPTTPHKKEKESEVKTKRANHNSSKITERQAYND